MPTLMSIDSHQTTIQAELFAPQVASRKAVIIAHGSDGMNEPWAAMIRDYAAKLSSKGCTAVIPHYFEKTATQPGLGVFSEIAARIDAWQEAVSDTVLYSRTMLGASEAGLLGFSLGGNIALRLRGLCTALVEYFAPELAGIGASVALPRQVQIHHGLADQLVPFSDAQRIQAALAGAGVTPELFSYEGAGHGFAGSDLYNAAARRSSQDRTLSFFERWMQ